VSKKKLVNKISPCIGICKLDETTNLCTGCFRTSYEIAKWPQLDNKKALKIMEEIKKKYPAKKVSY
jgi:uncharacterized protein